ARCSRCRSALETTPATDCATGRKAARGQPGRGTSTPTLTWDCASGWRWPPDGRSAAVTALARWLLLFRRLAGRARGAAVFLRLRDRQLLQVALGHEADEDAVRLVVPRHAADHGHQGGAVGRRRGGRLVFCSGGRLGVGRRRGVEVRLGRGGLAGLTVGA